MSSQIAIRLEESELAVLDAEVSDGHAATRSDAVRRAIAYLNRQRGYRRDAAILADVAAAGEVLYPDLAPIRAVDLSELDA